MGMASCFAAIDPKTMARLRGDPDLIEDFISPDDGDGEPPNYFDVDKSWHCIHFMLCGSAAMCGSALSQAILGGEEVGDDVGYGPVRILEPQQVREIADALSAIDSATFKARYKPLDMEAAGIYLADMCVRDGDAALPYLLANYLGLVTFYRDAAQRDDGVVIWLC